LSDSIYKAKRVLRSFIVLAAPLCTTHRFVEQATLKNCLTWIFEVGCSFIKQGVHKGAAKRMNDIT